MAGIGFLSFQWLRQVSVAPLWEFKSLKLPPLASNPSDAFPFDSNLDACDGGICTVANRGLCVRQHSVAAARVNL